MRRTALTPAMVAGLALAAACSSTSGGTSPSSTSASSTTTSATSGPTSGPATTARSSATTSRSTATTGGGSSAAVSTEGPCGWLTVDEIEQATGQQVDRASVVRGGCRWSDGTTPVVDLEVEAASDGASSFAAEKTIYADASVTLPDIGDDRYWAGLDDKLVFLDGTTTYTVWIQSIDDESRIQPSAIALARSVEQRRS